MERTARLVVVNLQSFEKEFQDEQATGQHRRVPCTGHRSLRTIAEQFDDLTERATAEQFTRQGFFYAARAGFGCAEPALRFDAEPAFAEPAFAEPVFAKPAFAKPALAEPVFRFGAEPAFELGEGPAVQFS